MMAISPEQIEMETLEAKIAELGLEKEWEEVIDKQVNRAKDDLMKSTSKKGPYVNS